MSKFLQILRAIAGMGMVAAPIIEHINPPIGLLVSLISGAVMNAENAVLGPNSGPVKSQLTVAAISADLPGIVEKLLAAAGAAEVQDPQELAEGINGMKDSLVKILHATGHFKHASQ